VVLDHESIHIVQSSTFVHIVVCDGAPLGLPFLWIDMSLADWQALIVYTCIGFIGPLALFKSFCVLPYGLLSRRRYRVFAFSVASSAALAKLAVTRIIYEETHARISDELHRTRNVSVDIFHAVDDKP
jgi:hypothetical protein